MPRYFILWSALLLYFLLPHPLPFPIAAKDHGFYADFLKWAKAHCYRQFQNKDLAELTLSYFLGGQRKLSPALKEAHRVLGLSHLFSPSGLHLSSVLFLFFPLGLMGKGSKKIQSFLKFSFLSAIFFLPKFYALKRMALFKLANISFAKLGINLSYFSIFLLIFFLDFTFGTFRYSPMGFLLSYLFLGVILSTQETPLIVRAWHLWLAQILVSIWLVQDYFLLSFFFNVVLTALFTLAYPILCLLLLASSNSTAVGLLEAMLKLYLELILKCAQWAKASPHLSPSLSLYVCVLIFLSLRRGWARTVYALAALYFYPN